jgi:hypothetical protein
MCGRVEKVGIVWMDGLNKAVVVFVFSRLMEACV